MWKKLRKLLKKQRGGLLRLFLLSVLVFALTFCEYRWLVGSVAEIAYSDAVELQKQQLERTVESYIGMLRDRENAFRTLYPEESEEALRGRLLRELKRRAYREVYEDDTYVWVNEILNYEGGDGFAVRIVHPAQKNMEGTLLSTETRDACGKPSNLIALEGVKKSSALFQECDFLRLRSAEIGRKLIYSKLYADYGWVICMGVNLENIDFYAEAARSRIRPVILLGTAGLELLLVSAFAYLSLQRKRLEQEHYLREQKLLTDELNLDHLTGAGSRRYGEMLLRGRTEHRKPGENAVIVMVADIDRFKTVNDLYGHEAGDAALCAFVKAVKSVIRTTDTISRFGGDEFVGIFTGSRTEGIGRIGDKILAAVRDIEVSAKGQRFRITCSIGFTALRQGEKDYEELLKRADTALYQAKERGRDRYEILL